MIIYWVLKSRFSFFLPKYIPGPSEDKDSRPGRNFQTVQFFKSLSSTTITKRELSKFDIKIRIETMSHTHTPHAFFVYLNTNRITLYA